MPRGGGWMKTKSALYPPGTAWEGEIDMDIKIVFSDIDGTILNKHHQPTPRTVETIQRLCQEGRPFVLVSARMPRGVYTVQRQLGITQPIVAYSGGLILDEKGDTLLSRGFCPAKALEIKGYVDHKGTCCSVYSGDQWYVDDQSDPWIQQEITITKVTPIEGNMKDLLDGTSVVHKLLLMGQPQRIETLEQELKQRFEGLRIYRSKSTYLEIMDESASKSEAVKELCRLKGIPIEQSVSFGDHFNDIDMLAATGMGFAMANAPRQVREMANHVAKSNEEDGVARAICGLMGWQ